MVAKLFEAGKTILSARFYASSPVVRSQLLPARLYIYNIYLYISYIYSASQSFHMQVHSQQIGTAINMRRLKYSENE